jgi:hypothetical protein
MSEARLDPPYEAHDASPFAPSGAIYFMDGRSDATVELKNGDVFTLEFHDAGTSIAASAPLPRPDAATEGVFVPAPPPLPPIAVYPAAAPERYRAGASLHLLQVVSMNMQSADKESRLLIGIPYAEARPDIFFGDLGFDDGRSDAASFGVVQSLLERHPHGQGYPARSFFGIYHLIETPAGTFFNKKATQMELQPSADGKLALTLPPIPFEYELLNGPIPLFDVDDPGGEPIGEIVAAHHRSDEAAAAVAPEAWPWHSPDLGEIERRKESR